MEIWYIYASLMVNINTFLNNFWNWFGNWYIYTSLMRYINTFLNSIWNWFGIWHWYIYTSRMGNINTFLNNFRKSIYMYINLSFPKRYTQKIDCTSCAGFQKASKIITRLLLSVTWRQINKYCHLEFSKFGINWAVCSRDANQGDISHMMICSAL